MRGRAIDDTNRYSNRGRSRFGSDAKVGLGFDGDDFS